MIQKSKVSNYKPSRDLEIKWESFNGGWNNFAKPTEARDNELVQADNLMLTGFGTPTGRWGSVINHLAGESGNVRLLDGYYDSLSSTNHLLAITDSGYLTKQSGASYAILTGASFFSGQNYMSVQLAKNTYIATASQNFIKFNGTNLIPYTSLNHPTNVSVAMLSSASGFNTYSWIVAASSLTGETSPYDFSPVYAKSLASLPLDLTSTSIKLTWNTVSAAPSVLSGYNIYRGFPGDETWIASVGPSVTQYYDNGVPQSNTIFPQTSNTTAGPKAKYIIRVDDRLVLAGIAGEPSKVLISARYPYHDRFTAIDGGGYTYVSPDDGDDITGLGIANLQQNPYIVVFKNNSVHTITLATVALGNYSILDPQVHLLTASNGCSSADTIQAVENDTFYFGRKGLYVIGQEPQFLNQIRTNELSARIRPYVRNLSDANFRTACAGYLDNKYILSFPDLQESVIYDRERAAFMGPWKTPFGITKWLRYYDGTGNEKWLAGSKDTPYVRELNSSYITDSGSAIAKTLRTKKEDMGDWSIFKVLKLFYVLFRNVRGSVTVNLRIEDRTGNTVTTKSFNITSSLGSGGWGNDQWGAQPYGQTDATITLTGDELVRYANIYKNCRVVQVEVISTAANTNFEFLGLRMTAQGLGDSSLPATTRV